MKCGTGCGAPTPSAGSAATRIGWQKRGGRRDRITATSSCTSNRAGRWIAAGIPIGVVEGIVAIDRFDAKITGVANHAGTTPIAERHDALLAAAHLTVAVRDAVTRVPGRQVGTVGHIEATPNSPNVIPGFARISIELRDLSPRTLVTMMDDIRARAREIAANTETTIEFTQTMEAAPAVATPEVQRAIESAAHAAGLQTTRLPSGAGHDAQMMALLGPMGMIFVPSVGGISHAPTGVDPLGRLRAGRRRVAAGRAGDGSGRLSRNLRHSLRSSIQGHTPEGSRTHTPEAPAAMPVRERAARSGQGHQRAGTALS